MALTTEQKEQIVEIRRLFSEIANMNVTEEQIFEASVYIGLTVRSWDIPLKSVRYNILGKVKGGVRKFRFHIPKLLIEFGIFEAPEKSREEERLAIFGHCLGFEGFDLEQRIFITGLPLKHKENKVGYKLVMALKKRYTLFREARLGA